MKEQIRILAAGLNVDETGRYVCPRCTGGSSGETTFTVTRNRAGLIFRCYRDKCGIKGFVPTEGSLVASEKPQKPNKTRKFTEEIAPLTDEQRLQFKQQYFLTDQEVSALGVMYVPSRNAYYYPVHDWRNFYIGCTIRAIPPFTGPKSLSYPENPPDIPFMAFYGVERGSKKILVVEDQVSAVAASTYQPAVALIGTSVNEQKIGVLTRLTDHLIMALDRDAIATAARHKLKYGLSFNKFEILPLEKDIKNMDHNERDRLLRRFV